MAKTFTVKRLAQAVLPGAPAEATDSLMRQIDHWTLTGLYELADAGPAEVHVGRGKPRRYPAKALYWTALLHHMAGRGLLVLNMKQAMGTLGRREKKAPFVDGVINGDGPDAFLVMSSTPRALSYQYCSGSLGKAELGLSGSYFNLTKIFGSVREAVRKAKVTAA